jgi:hypothetical protein
MKISLATAVSITDLSENTLRRRIAQGVMTRTIEEGSNGRSMITFDTLKAECCFPLNDDDILLIEEADQGNSEAQNDLALLFLSHKKPRKAIYWLELAIKQKNKDAMHWLGRCYIEGNGITQDENLGLMWLAKAAAEGHFISREIMQLIRQKVMNRAEVPSIAIVDLPRQ